MERAMSRKQIRYRAIRSRELKVSDPRCNVDAIIVNH